MRNDEISHEDLMEMVRALPITYRMNGFVMFGPIAIAIMTGMAALALPFFPKLMMGMVNPLVPAAVLLAIAGGVWLKAWLEWKSVALVVREDGISYRTGVLTQNAHNVTIGKIVSVDVSQQLGTKGMGFGNVIITTSGTEVVTCKNMAQVQEIQYLISHLAAATREMGADGIAKLRE